MNEGKIFLWLFVAIAAIAAVIMLGVVLIPLALIGGICYIVYLWANKPRVVAVETPPVVQPLPPVKSEADFLEDVFDVVLETAPDFPIAPSAPVTFPRPFRPFPSP